GGGAAAPRLGSPPTARRPWLPCRRPSGGAPAPPSGSRSGYAWRLARAGGHDTRIARAFDARPRRRHRCWRGVPRPRAPRERPRRPPAPAAPAPERELAYVTNEDSGTLSVVSTAHDRVVAEIPVGRRPRGLKLSPDGRTVYVALSGSPKCPPSMPDAEC